MLPSVNYFLYILPLFLHTATKCYHAKAFTGLLLVIFVTQYSNHTTLLTLANPRASLSLGNQAPQEHTYFIHTLFSFVWKQVWMFYRGKWQGSRPFVLEFHYEAHLCMSLPLRILKNFLKHKKIFDPASYSSQLLSFSSPKFINHY